MNELAKLLDSMLQREGLENNEYLLRNLTPNLLIPLSSLQKVEALIQYHSLQIIDALNQCRNCKLHKQHIQVLIQPKTTNIIINDIDSKNSDFKEQLIEKYLKNIDYEIQVNGYVKIIFKNFDDVQHIYQAYVEPENVFQSLIQSLKRGNNILQTPLQYQIKSHFKLYFLKGLDNRQLSYINQRQLLHFTKMDPYSHSFIVYRQNSYKIIEKYKINQKIHINLKKRQIIGNKIQHGQLHIMLQRVIQLIFYWRILQLDLMELLTVLLKKKQKRYLNQEFLDQKQYLVIQQKRRKIFSLQYKMVFRLHVQIQQMNLQKFKIQHLR
ncbi:unnamed protein product [Paramecium sonneborni]|uniref:Uncharacterized protein n=1 Tax=Paramecium sonneborni TaxID=65129 RepID=A0A8S1RLF7_9CILI|nr:unnamed protein product [Paramecium sonneborni]